jgi:hypothetical protein
VKRDDDNDNAIGGHGAADRALRELISVIRDIPQVPQLPTCTLRRNSRFLAVVIDAAPVTALTELQLRAEEICLKREAQREHEAFARRQQTTKATKTKSGKVADRDAPVIDMLADRAVAADPGGDLSFLEDGRSAWKKIDPDGSLRRKLSVDGKRMPSDATLGRKLKAVKKAALLKIQRAKSSKRDGVTT